MQNCINTKTFVCAGFIMLALYNLIRAYIHLALHQSIDAAAGFMMGLLFALFLYIQVKCVGYLYGVAQEWLSERRARRSQYSGAER